MKEQNEDLGYVDIFEENTIITLFDEDNSPIEFYEIASVEYKEKFYEILQPVEQLEGLEEDEAVIFEYEVDEVTSDKVFKPVFDEKLLNEVFSTYLRVAADYESTCGDHCGCGCGDDDCDCDDDDCDCDDHDCEEDGCHCDHKHK